MALPVGRLKRIMLVALAAVGALVYVWIAAVRAVPGVRARKLAARRTDPLEFFRAKLAGGLLPERAYAGLVTTAKRVGVRG